MSYAHKIDGMVGQHLARWQLEITLASHLRGRWDDLEQVERHRPLDAQAEAVARVLAPPAQAAEWVCGRYLPPAPATRAGPRHTLRQSPRRHLEQRGA